MTDFIDACPVCVPGDPPASPVIGTLEQVPGGIVTTHQCAICETAWSTFWREGWPIDRLIAPVRNRDVLASAVQPRRDAA